MKERKIVGSGIEHIVYESHNSQYVLKRPRVSTRLALFTTGDTVQTIRDELQEAYIVAEKTSLVIPKTRVITQTPHSYIMIQEKITPNGNKSPESIVNQNPTSMPYLRYISNPNNFIMHDETLYWIDPTKGPILRLLNKYTAIDEYAFRRIWTDCKRKITFFTEKLSNLRSN
jgi:hypothetical protein